MNKLLLKTMISALIGIILLSPMLVFADPPAPPIQPPNTLKPNIANETDLILKINGISNFIFGILIAVAIAMIVVSAFQFLTAGGSTEKVGKAKKALMYALIAVIIALASRGIIKVIGALVGRTDLTV